MLKHCNILISVPHLSHVGGVSAFWNALFKSFKNYTDIHFKILEIGGHGKNILGPIVDQWKFYRSCKTEINIALINPSLLSKSFFRDGFFAKQLSLKQIPFIVFFHGWDLDFEKTVSKRYIKFFLNSFGKAEKIFVLSEEFKEKIIEWGYKGQVIIQTTTVDATLSHNFSLKHKLTNSNNNPTKKILFLSRIVKEKGIFELIDAFKNLNERVDNIELIIAGEGEAFEQLKTVVKNINNIRVTGHVEGKRKIALFKESDIYILPSYTEGLPISILEAMLFGLPIITTKVGGLKKFFKPEKMGCFIEVKNTIEIENKIELILSNKDKLEQMSRFNYNYAQKYLTNDVVAKVLANHIKELI
jgi:glycosyltransferase involved in cell wall biosynthesis